MRLLAKHFKLAPANVISVLGYCILVTAAWVLTITASNAEQESRIRPLLVQPSDFNYRGVFLLPNDSQNSSWEYSGYAMTYYPNGDPGGKDDGFPGSLFAVGHDHHQMVSEISIPVPVISSDPSKLNRATTLQDFSDINSGVFGELEIPRAGICYLPPLGNQTSGKLHFTWGQHFQFEQVPSHGWAELDLEKPSLSGPWLIGDYPNYVLNDYLFEIPESWSNQHAPGLRLATGRFRDGVWSGLGPALFAIAPWEEGNPPRAGTRLEKVVPLLLYGEVRPGHPEIDVSAGHRMNDFSEADEWSGGAWLTSGEKSAVIFLGTKAVGKSWYGFSNGIVYPTSSSPDTVYPELPEWPHDDRGWWSSEIKAQLLFFDPNQLAAVAKGKMETWQPQPYAVLDLTEYLLSPDFDYANYKRYLVGAMAFDRKKGLLYLIERQAVHEGQSVVHVFSITE